MITVQHAHSANETYEFIHKLGSRAWPSAQKMAVLMRTGGRIDMLVFSDRQGDSRYIPNVGGHIGDGLNALMGSGALLDVSSILVIHHYDGAVLTSRHGNRIMDLIADSNQVGSLQGCAPGTGCSR
jgi:hypothetical protein